MRVAVLILMLMVSGCAAAPVALGTGSVVADIVLGEAIRVAAGAMAEEVVPPLLGDAGGLVAGGGDFLGRLLPFRRQKVEVINGLVFVGDWR